MEWISVPIPTKTTTDIKNPLASCASVNMLPPKKTGVTMATSATAWITAIINPQTKTGTAWLSVSGFFFR